MFNITLVAGARPNFMKIAPIIHEIKNAQTRGLDIDYRLVHTGQHYDENMSGSFFKQLSMPQPHINLECAGGSQNEQTAQIMIAFEQELLNHPTDLVLVVGDVNSTMACAIVAKKCNIKVAHVEGGIRSNDLSMPEEINRMVTDSISDYFFTTTESANTNLLNNGVEAEQIFLVGNTMIDTLLKHRPSFFKPPIWSHLKLQPKSYIVLTMHRPANVDEGETLKLMIDEILENTKELPIVFPVHPRTANSLKNLNIEDSRLHFIDPLSYLEFNYLVENAKAVITDSGGITEEASLLNVPCLTLRDNTERPETIDLGTNELVGTNPKNLKKHLDTLFDGTWKASQPIPFWDGKTAQRIIEIIEKKIIKN